MEDREAAIGYVLVRAPLYPLLHLLLDAADAVSSGEEIYEIVNKEVPSGGGVASLRGGVGT